MGLTGRGERGPDAGAEDGAFDAVFLDLLERLYRRAALMTGSRQSAEDAVHEVYLKLAPHPRRLVDHPEPYAYAFATLVSVVRDAWRRERRQVPVGQVDDGVLWETANGRGGGSVGGAVGGAVGGVGVAPLDGGVERRVAELEAVRLLRQLSLRQAGVVILVDLDGYTIDQAADILRLHRGTVSRTRLRALRKLRGLLGAA
ncbi:RNA polymerase sigma factor [Streptomyces sp. DSM 44917]|uniref:RNA polymerase sigma factor n=1 Tax=Streptomyces boetiae TaxID=3075541 RepID=A0ABU2LCP6_9ACTN|nr:RNA polymerase sigma factor [Streptomyces sp. DSM 44917]MDT0309344.1 RNA polymerase sigma factor [Streptomyces sp. DSM 44917]